MKSAPVYLPHLQVLRNSDGSCRQAVRFWLTGFSDWHLERMRFDSEGERIERVISTATYPSKETAIAAFRAHGKRVSFWR